MKHIFETELRKIVDKKLVSFHVPGHKNGEIFKKLGIIEAGLTHGLDVTEIPGTDNLHQPRGFIKASQDRVANIIGANASFFLVNGTTCGIYAMMMSVCKSGDKIVIARDCHRAVFSGLYLGDLKPIYIQPEIRSHDQLNLGITSESVEVALRYNKGVKAVVITHPTYYGVCSDIEAIAAVCKKYDARLLVDEAHGAHLHLHDDLPKSAVCLGADMVVHSTHKTLPALTQSSVLHVVSDRVDMERLKLMLSIHQTSSPSYLLMNSIDLAMDIGESKGRDLMQETLESIDALHIRLKAINGVEVLGQDVMTSNSVKGLDTSKIVFSMVGRGLSGTMLENLLRDEYGIQIEMSDHYYAVAVATIGNDKLDYTKLGDAISDLAMRYSLKSIKDFETLKKWPLSNQETSIRRGIDGDKEWLALDVCLGRICGEYVIPYPPGIPLLVPGERITEDVIEAIEALKTFKKNTIGMADPSLNKLRVLTDYQ